MIDVSQIGTQNDVDAPILSDLKTGYRGRKVGQDLNLPDGKYDILQSLPVGLFFPPYCYGKIQVPNQATTFGSKFSPTARVRLGQCLQLECPGPEPGPRRFYSNELNTWHASL